MFDEISEIAYLLLKEGIRGDYVLKFNRIRILLYFIGRNEDEMDGLVCPRRDSKTVPTVLDFLFFLGCHLVGLLGVFHLTNVYNTVIAVDEQINLRTFSFESGGLTPRADPAYGAEDTEGFLDLSDVQKTNTLKSEPAPVVV